MVERFNSRIEEVLRSHRFRAGEKLGTMLIRYVWIYLKDLCITTDFPIDQNLYNFVDRVGFFMDIFS